MCIYFYSYKKLSRLEVVVVVFDLLLTTGDSETDGRTDERTDGRTDERTGRRADGRTGGRADGRTGGWADGRVDGRTGGWMSRYGINYSLCSPSMSINSLSAYQHACIVKGNMLNCKTTSQDL